MIFLRAVRRDLKRVYLTRCIFSLFPPLLLRTFSRILICPASLERLPFLKAVVQAYQVLFLF